MEEDQPVVRCREGVAVHQDLLLWNTPSDVFIAVVGRVLSMPTRYVLHLATIVAIYHDMSGLPCSRPYVSELNVCAALSMYDAGSNGSKEVRDVQDGRFSFHDARRPIPLQEV